MPSKRNLWDGFAISRRLETFLRRLWFSIFPLFIEKPPWKLENIFFQKFDSKICINETHRGKFKFPKRKGNNETLRTKRSNFDHFYHFTQLCSSFLFLISLSRGKRIHLFFKPRIEREGREKKHNLISPRTWILKKIKIPKEKGRVYYPKNKYRALEISRIQTKRRGEKWEGKRDDSHHVKLEPVRREVDVEERDETSTCRRVSWRRLRGEGSGWWSRAGRYSRKSRTRRAARKFARMEI